MKASRLQSSASPIAIVGLSSILPGSLTTNKAWDTILQRKDCITDVPPSHWLKEDYFDPEASEFSKVYTKTGGFVADIPFDPVEFGMPPNTLAATDTNQLLALIGAKRLLQSVKSIASDKVSLKDIGIILGVAAGSEMQEQMSAKIQKPVWTKVLREHGLAEDEVETICSNIIEQYPDWTENTFPGLLSNVVAGRVANKLNLGGCNFVTDAACASSLAAVNMAMHELTTGNADIVFTGGVDALSNIFMYMCFTKTPALSPTGDIRPFSNDGDGTILGEGVVLFALRRLEDAERDGDDIYAVLNACGSSSDGKFKSIYAPSPEGQSRAINKTYAQLNYGLGDVGLIEAHGTGTKAGDAAEFKGLSMAFNSDDSTTDKANQYCALGTIKSQIGHAKSTAGAAGLLKAVFALQHKTLPPTIKISSPNDKLDIENSPLYLNTEPRPWIQPPEQPRRAGVSSFGFGGSNFHLNIEEYNKQGHSPKEIFFKDPSHEIMLCFSADSAAELGVQIDKIKDQLNKNKHSLINIARQSQEQFNSRHLLRLSLVAKDTTKVLTLLANFLDKCDLASDNSYTIANSLFFQRGQAQSKVAFIFSGQGGQYLNMGRELLCQYRQSLTPWNIAAGLDWSRVDSTHGTSDESRAERKHKSAKSLEQVVYPIPAFTEEVRQAQQESISQIKWIQPALGGLSLSHLEIIKTLGLQADATAGHSYGELPALFAAGVISSTEDLFRLSQQRAAVMADAASSEQNSTNPGGMSAIMAGSTTVEELLATFNKSNKKSKSNQPVLTIANYNSPKQTVITGALADLDSFEQQLSQQGLAFKRLNVPTAFHSSWVSAGEKAFQHTLSDKKLATATIPVYSNLTGEAYPSTETEIKTTLSQQLAKPVKFQQLIEQMAADGITTFIELGAGKALSQLVKDTLAEKTANQNQNKRSDNSTNSSTDKPTKKNDEQYHVLSFDGGAKLDAMSAMWRALAQMAAIGLDIDLAALWQGFALEEIEPHKDDYSKATVMINGANIGKIYPPQGGAAALPKANTVNTGSAKPENQLTSQQASHQQVPHQQASHQPQSNPQSQLETENHLEIQSSAGNQAHISQPIPPHSNQLESAVTQNKQETLIASTSTPAATSVTTHNPQWLETVQKVQQTALEAQKAFQETLAQSHMAYLQSTEKVIQQLVSGVGGEQASPLSHSIAHSIAQPIAQPIPQPAIKVLAQTAPQSVTQATPQVDPQVITQNSAPSASQPAAQATMQPYTETAPVPVPTPQNATVTIEKPPVKSVIEDKVATASIADNFETILLDIVAEKTGYPQEMLDLSLDMESGLGIDSIKRVEILSALQAIIPQLAEVDTTQLAAMNTLQEILSFADSTTAPAASPAVTASHSTSTETAPFTNAEQADTSGAVADTQGLQTDDFEATLLAIVAEKTGYPEEMLDLELDMESGLGIDSIKRVEILSALQAVVPGLADVDTTQLAAMNTLQEILTFSQEATAPFA